MGLERSMFVTVWGVGGGYWALLSRMEIRSQVIRKLETTILREGSKNCPSASQVSVRTGAAEQPGTVKPVSQKGLTPRLLSLEVPLL